uniref:Craniofacial development protein 2 n=1 Tax=Cacopsylla melanoneura TaxID=428564 RepID=A0A8D9E0P6_9HEMI
MKDQFYQDLENLMTSLPTYDIKIMMGDANAKIGREECWKDVVGTNSLHSITNDNGLRLIHFASSRNMNIVSTQFPRKNIHKITWVSPAGNVQNQIDHILIDNRQKSSIMNVRTRRGAECGSDHYLVQITLRQRIKCEGKKEQRMAPLLDLEKLKSIEIRNEFNLKTANLFEALEQQEGLQH